MHDYDIQTTFNDLAHTFEEFKKLNEERLSHLESQHMDTSDFQSKMERLQETMDQAELRLKKMEVHNLRPLLETTTDSTCQHTNAFLDYVRKGTETSLHNYETKSLSVGSDRDGGYLVPSGLHDRLYATLIETSVMHSLAHVREISTSALEMLIDKDSLMRDGFGDGRARRNTHARAGKN
ncbi:phage major capsid protein [Geitlerinema splendidum]|nr:phage major capsid protein [Geitlerinema splendidum]